ncbi:pyridoxal phosphate-dependent transferase [Pilobolus umbonatus]|nr:pyridoxal phosphate-dependent transferase [Pilobolus umbonatus]
MTRKLDKTLDSILDKRRQISRIRSLTVNPSNAIDFSSNDFLGLSSNSEFKVNYLNELQLLDNVNGSTGSRLLDGNSLYCEDLEKRVAYFHHSEKALIFNSGFDANVSLFGCVPQPGDVIVYDELIHASVHEGMKISRAGKKIPFAHSCVEDFERVLQNVISEFPDKNIFIAVESVYSMDGDIAPLAELVAVMRKYWPNQENGYMIVDEAHSNGVFGDQGRGIVCELGLEDIMFARLHTFGKALASNGAAVLGSNILRNYLINYARPLIYSTFMPYNSLASIKCAYDLLESGKSVPLQNHLTELIQFFRSTISLPADMLLPSSTPIQGIVLNGNEPVRKLARYLNNKGFNVKPIASPTVPVGQERVRICLHGNNTFMQVSSLIKEIHIYFDIQSIQHKALSVSAKL